jgi:hypothetical protein
MSYQNGLVTANINLTASSKKALTFVTLTNNGTFATAGAGKAIRVISVSMTMSDYSDTTARIINIQNDGVIIAQVTGLTSATDSRNVVYSMRYDYTACPVVAATKALTFLADGSCSATVGYIEEDV